MQQRQQNSVHNGLNLFVGALVLPTEAVVHQHCRSAGAPTAKTIAAGMRSGFLVSIGVTVATILVVLFMIKTPGRTEATDEAENAAEQAGQAS